jgi:molecular chaperone IbpA
MRTYDFTPPWRSSIGFDRLFELINSAQVSENEGYPPYDIVRLGDDVYRISLALAGFAPDDITITAQQNLLTVGGRRAHAGEREYLYQGIATRPFERQFSLADFVEVAGASFENGLLQIDLIRKVPEAMKPRRIEIRRTTESPGKSEKTAPAHIKVA